MTDTGASADTNPWHRVEALIGALDRIADPVAREPARELIELLLDLHTLALTRITAALADRDPALLDGLAADERVRAVLLLHGLHPDALEKRVCASLERLRPGLAARGWRAEVVHVSATAARVRAEQIGSNARPSEAIVLRREIEAAIVEAAPDLEELAIDGFDDGALAETATALAG